MNDKNEDRPQEKAKEKAVPPADPVKDIKPSEQQVVTTRPMLEVLGILSKDADLAKIYAREVVQQEVARALYDQDGRLARVFAMSGYFDDINGSTLEQALSQAMTKIQLGRSWQMQPADAMQHVYFTNGKPNVQNEFLAARMRDYGLDWDIEWFRSDKGICIGCSLWMKRRNPATGLYEPIMERENGQSSQARVTFTKKDADEAMIWEKGKQIRLSEKWNYKSWPEDMYYWRCVARARRRYATNVLTGALTRDEADEVPTREINPELSGESKIGSETRFDHGARLRKQMEEQAAQAREEAEKQAVNDIKAGSTATEATAEANASAETKGPATETKSGWPNRAAMMEDFTALFVALGEQASWNILGTYSISEEAELDRKSVV